MRLLRNNIILSPTDLARFLACRHTATLELEAARGLRERSHYTDPLGDLLRERGQQHERRYVEQLRATGRSVGDLTVSADEARPPHLQLVARTLDAMRRGVDVIVQAPLGNEMWTAFADVLVKVDTPSSLGPWSYEAHDTKLARETRAGAILQLSVYTELLAEMQGVVPEHFHVVTPAGSHTFRFDDFAAYYRLVKKNLQRAIVAGTTTATYPDPVEYCGTCNWWETCNAQRRKDDHIQFVAGLGRGHRQELERLEITTLAGLADWGVPSEFRPTRGGRGTFVKLQEQAALQHLQQQTKTPQFRILPLEPHLADDGTPLPLRGLKRLPEPSTADLYLDLEADPFGRSSLGTEAGESSREYLFGLGWVDDEGQFRYQSWWAFDDATERAAFEALMDRISQVTEQHSAAHVYHYAPYEPSALKRLAGRYATRVDALDVMLRAGTLVDLYAVVRQSIRAGVESYSIKEMEQYYGFVRDVDLRQAGRERQVIEVALESGDVDAISPEVQDAVEGYNRDDVRSTRELQAWLEARRAELVAGGEDLPRPVPTEGQPSEKVKERDQRVADLRERLLAGVPPSAAERSPDEQARYLMAYLLDWHRREGKSEWWDFFRLADLERDELLDERKAIADLAFVECLGPVVSEKTGKPGKLVIDRYRFPLQECDIRKDDDLYLSDHEKWGAVAAFDRERGTIDVRPLQARAGLRPAGCFAYKYIPPTSIENALYEIGVALADGAPDVLPLALLRADPPPSRAALELQDGVLAIQGPPGTGKTYRGGVMICDLVAGGKTVGVTAHSHAAIANLLKAARKEASHRKTSVALAHVQPNGSSDFDDADPKVVGGTAWHWTSDKAEHVDVLFVDEAGQMSLANVLACSVAANAMVLLGDPQQLEQPTKGVHPEGVDGSALQHILAGHKTMPPERGEFLEVTRRLAPPIAEFTSECFYERRLRSLQGLERQVLRGDHAFAGAGLSVVSVSHHGNHNASDEEVGEVARIVDDLLAPGSEWVDENGDAHQIALDDVLIVSPFNAQVGRLQDKLPPGARVGTVDKFQGQEAPVVIYSMATSRPEDAPRGLGFLYSLNRFNVATSRARCRCILVASPRLFEPDCQSPAQMQLANALCRYREMTDVSTQKHVVD